MYGRYPEPTYGYTQPFVSPPRPPVQPPQFHAGFGQNQSTGIGDFLKYAQMARAMQQQNSGGGSGGMGGGNGMGGLSKMMGGGGTQSSIGDPFSASGAGTMDMFPMGMDAGGMGGMGGGFDMLGGGNGLDMFGGGMGGGMDMFGAGMDAGAMSGYGGGSMDMFPAGMDASQMSGGPYGFGGGSYAPFATAGLEIAGYGNKDSLGNYIGGSHADSQDPIGPIAGPIAGGIVDYGTGGWLGSLFSLGSMFG